MAAVAPPMRASWLTLSIVFAAAFAAFWPALSNDFVDWDDTDNFVHNPNFRGLGWSSLSWMFTTFHMGHYQPLAWLTLGWDAVWGQWVFGPHPEHGPGMHPRAYHITNNLLHSINAALVYVLALRLLTWPTIWVEDRPKWLGHLAAAAAALLFSLHPLRTENVAWITERRDLVSALLLLLTTLAWLRAVHPGQQRFGRWYALALTLYALSLIAKVAGVPLIAAMLLLDWHPLRRIGTSRGPLANIFEPAGLRVLTEKAPFAVLAILFSIVATVGQSANNWIFPFERHPLIARIVQSFYGLAFYIWKTVLPTNLLPLYELRLPMPLGATQFIAAIVIVIVALALVVALRARWPGLMVAALCYAAFLGPVLGLFQNGPQIVADRYAYLPAVALSVLAGSMLIAAWKRLPRAAFVACCAVTAGVLCVLATLTWKQSHVWRSTASLWTYNCAKDPGSSFSQNGCGYVLLSAGDVDGAIPHFQEAIRIRPDNQKAHINLWNAYDSRNDLAALLAAYESATPVPSLQYQATLNKANQLLNSSRSAESVLFFELACRLDPDNANVRSNYGLALARSGQRENAEAQYRQAIQSAPDLFTARYNAGLNYRAMNRTQEARLHLEAAVRLRPDHRGARDALQSLAPGP